MAAAAAAVLATQNYTYGAGSQPNRQIQFSRTGQDAGSIQAQVFVLDANGALGTKISTFAGNRIDVEMQSTSEKTQARLRGMDLNPNRVLSTLTAPQQSALMQSLPGRVVEVMNGVGGPGGLEVVTSMTIVNLK